MNGISFDRYFCCLLQRTHWSKFCALEPRAGMGGIGCLRNKVGGHVGEGSWDSVIGNEGYGIY